MPQQPRLTVEQAERALDQYHMREVVGHSRSFFWGFDPIPEMSLPFCYRVEIDGGGDEESVPVFENRIYSSGFMLLHVSSWCKRQGFSMPWPPFDDFLSMIHDHLLLRAATGLDRRIRLDDFRLFQQQAEKVFGNNFVPAQEFAAIKLPDRDSMRLAAAYDLWRLGDYGLSKNYLSSKLGFEPHAPDLELF